jgi:hypothetical protein
LALFLGGFIVASTKLVADMSFQPRTKTATTEAFAPKFGNLTLSATLASENEVILNVTFYGRIYVTQPGFVWTIRISNTSIGYDWTNLPEGLELAEGSLKMNGTSPLPNNSLSLQAKIRAVKDGEWTIYGHFSATCGPGFYMSLSAIGIRIIVSNGQIIRIEKEQTTVLLPSESGGEMQKVPSPP